ncbi:MAG: polyphosphate--glucose phosphotransferase [Anaerolineae bacterium]
MVILGIDIGGTGIKGALVDCETGRLAGERLRLPTPAGFQPDEVIATITELIRHFDYDGPVGAGFPAVVIDGRVMTPPTSLSVKGWEAYPVAERISRAAGRRVTVMNDADVAGLAEMRFGAGRGQMGVVMVFTLGTGIGSVLFVDGVMVPNLELGRLYLRNRRKVVEYQAAERARKEKKLSWKAWGKNLNKYFNHIERIFSPRLIIIGGGVSKKHEKFLPYIHVRAGVVPAALRNKAGIIGAALAAVPA